MRLISQGLLPKENDFLIDKFKLLLLIRKVELSIGLESKAKSFKTPVHLAIGQEAIAVGISEFLKNSDYVFGNHRSHAHYLALGGSPQELISEILGKKDGCSSGRGGSMHIKAPDKGFMGSMPIVAGTISIAVGAGLQIPKSSDQISVSYFGDGATEEGVFHESLNFASRFAVPTLFVCENNLFSSHMHIEERQNNFEISRFAECNGIKNFQVDGNDLLQVMDVAKEAISYIRSERKPAFIEAHTYRIFSHVGFDEDLAVGNHRLSDLEIWKKRDPIDILRNEITGRFDSDFNLDEIESIVDLQVANYWRIAKSSEYPSESELFSGVYMDKI